MHIPGGRRGHLILLAGLLLICVALLSCGKKKPLLPAPPKPAAGMPGAARTGEVIQRGLASWYGRPYHGRHTASGEIYDMETMVAAHRTLPFQTRLLVRNLTNGKTVEVRIIDRGPFVGSRIIDLSHAAARQIDLIGPGIAEVELSLAEATVAPAVSFFGVQIGAFQDRANAERNAAAMRQIYGAALIVERPGEPILFRVLAGKEPAQDLAEALAGRIRREQNTPQAFVVRLDQ